MESIDVLRALADCGVMVAAAILVFLAGRNSGFRGGPKRRHPLPVNDSVLLRRKRGVSA